MMSVAWQRPVDIIATRARRIACIVNAVIDRRPGRLRIWRIVSLGDASFFSFFFPARPGSKREIQQYSTAHAHLEIWPSLIRSWAHIVLLHMTILLRSRSDNVSP